MRTFVAIEISDGSIINSIKKFQTEININANPVESKNFHFTLQFLGEISAEISQKAIHAIQKIEFSSFSVKLRGVGAFPGPKFPRVIWIGTDESGGNKLIQLSNKVRKALEPLEFFSDRPFKPHITVFRIKKKVEDLRRELDGRKTMDFGIQRVTCIKLKKSVLGPNGPAYTDLEEIRAVR